MKTEEKIFETNWLGRKLSFRTGKLAKQATATAIVQYGETVVMATVVQDSVERDMDYFPLTVDFEERLYAAGVIKGSRWVKREGRPSDESVLTGRMIDRSIRPLFDDTCRKETQLILTVLAVDKENNHDIVALIAASAALSISGIKWDGPIAGVRVGRVDGNLIYNPTYEQMAKSDLDLIVAGTEERVLMIEAGAKEVAEDVVAEAVLSARGSMKEALELLRKFKKEITPKEAKEAKVLLSQEELEAAKKKEEVFAQSEKWLEENIDHTLFDKQYYTKGERKLAVKKIKEELDEFLFKQNISRDLRQKVLSVLVEKKIDEKVSNNILEGNRRVDGRSITEIRDLSAEVNLLPRIHGSSLFSRGETQVLSVVTLGSAGMEQSIENMEGESEKRYLHHYNFPPYCVGETGRMRGPGRREIGHGALAEKALVPVLPDKESFPYTVRVVSETLGSNGSSSMGSTCASSLALMDAGVPIKKHVAGIAMGLASNADMSKWVVLTDIQDLEDGKGGMDFKIAGTEAGITAIQLDTKTVGLNEDIIKQVFKQGREALNKILGILGDAIAQPRADLSPHAPRIISFRINPDKIRDVIGSGGKIINKIIKDYEVEIDIEDDGLVMVCGVNAEKSQGAVEYIKLLAHEFVAGEVFRGKVTRIMDFGAFVEVLPGSEGMVHVSELAPYRVSKPRDFFKEGDEVTVMIKEIDDQGRVNLTMKGLEANGAYWAEGKGKMDPSAERGSFGGGFGGRGRDSRGGGRDGGRGGERRRF